MSTNQTANYQLNQWTSEDPVLREEFNADNRRLDGALEALTAAMPHIAVGSYVGNGKYGFASPNTLTFPFSPKLVVITTNMPSELEQGTALIAGQTASSGIGCTSSSGSCLNLTVSWPKNGVSWYTSNDYADDQLNENRCTYFYFALG